MDQIWAVCSWLKCGHAMAAFGSDDGLDWGIWYNFAIWEEWYIVCVYIVSSTYQLFLVLSNDAVIVRASFSRTFWAAEVYSLDRFKNMYTEISHVMYRGLSPALLQVIVVLAVEELPNSTTAILMNTVWVQLPISDSHCSLYLCTTVRGGHLKSYAI